MHPFAHFFVPWGPESARGTEAESLTARVWASPVAPWFSKTPVILVPLGNLAPNDPLESGCCCIQSACDSRVPQSHCCAKALQTRYLAFRRTWHIGAFSIFSDWMGEPSGQWKVPRPSSSLSWNCP